MKKMTKRRRKLNLFSSLWSSHFSCHERKKRSKVFTPIVDPTSLNARFAEKGKDLVTAPTDHIPIPGELEFQITDKLKGENRETLAEGCIEEGLSLKQALTNEVNGVQIVCEAKAPSCSEMRPCAAKSKFEDGKSKQQSRKTKIRITDKSIKPGPKLFNDESGILLKTVKHAVMDKLGDLLRNASINDNKSEKRGPGRPKSKPEHVVDGQNALIPYWGRGRARHEVDLDPESLRRWNQLMKIDSGEGEEEDRKRKEWWQREKITFNGRIDAFTSRSHQFLGDRRFRQWKGSVVDSVVGVFLTQNVSDHLSSAAYMSLVEKFLVQSTSNQQASMTIDGQKTIESSMTSIGATYDADGNRYFVTEVPEPDTNHGSKNLPAEKATATYDADGNRYFVTEVPEPDMNHGSKNLPAEKATCLLQEEVQRQNGIVRSEPQPDMNQGHKDLPAEKDTCLLQEDEQGQNGVVRSESEPDMNHGPKDLPAERAICLLQEEVHRQNGIVRSEPEPDMNLVSQYLLVENPMCLPREVVRRQPQNLPTALPICLPREVVKRQSGNETEKKNRSPNRKTASKETKKTIPRGKNKIVKDVVIRRRNWESLGKIYSRPRSKDQKDSVDWEAVRQAETSKVASIIEGRGQQTIIAGRIKQFLDRVVDMHKSIDLEWLRYAPPDDVKDYLLEFMGLGLKSVECVRLLSLQQVAFTVDVNVARIAVRLGWVPLKALPGSLQFHLIEEFPILDTIQKYLWPRLCELDHRTLYELHYHMITFGKVFCTKENPRCHACPMKAECKHYASAQASAANLSLPGPSKKSVDQSIVSSKPSRNSSSLGNNCDVKNPMSVTLLDANRTTESGRDVHTCKPIVEEPKSPQQEEDIEDFSWDGCIEDEEIPTIKLNREEFNPDGKKSPYSNSMSQALVSVGTTPLSAPKMKRVTSLRTEHQVYELPDNHEILVGLDKRERDDSLPYLLAIWQPGETPNSSQQPEKLCSSQGSQLCGQKTCFACEG
ncbi:PREDICTED: transcriptional activator DEMETER-like, partial [Populus euphratica]|uniref:Transcriptional activator DEMETER-like n=1 Tax=Populus euphratica TaxID=75702 RepID=A0AAJ6Y9M9_POPEU